MTGVTGPSRWADDEDDIAAEAQRKREKAERKRAKAAKQQQQIEQHQSSHLQGQENQDLLNKDRTSHQSKVGSSAADRQSTSPIHPNPPKKRRKLSPLAAEDAPVQLLRFNAPTWGPCRHVDNFEKLNHIEEGSYGWVSRAKELATGEIVALKKLKMEIAHDGFPITALREIKTLTESRHRHIVGLREVVVGDTLNESVGAHVALCFHVKALG